MRILTAASRRGIDTPYVQAEPSGHEHKVTLLMQVNQKQVGQLSRDWCAIVDVLDVHPAIAVQEIAEHTRSAQDTAAVTLMRQCRRFCRQKRLRIRLWRSQNLVSQLTQSPPVQILNWRRYLQHLFVNGTSASTLLVVIF